MDLLIFLVNKKEKKKANYKLGVGCRWGWGGDEQLISKIILMLLTQIPGSCNLIL